ncbi:14792_t:CDS:1, partial [Cetraspora pellucida]
VNLNKEDSIIKIEETSSESSNANKPSSEVWQYINKDPKNQFCKYSECNVVFSAKTSTASI